MFVGQRHDETAIGSIHRATGEGWGRTSKTMRHAIASETDHQARSVENCDGQSRQPIRFRENWSPAWGDLEAVVTATPRRRPAKAHCIDLALLRRRGMLRSAEQRQRVRALRPPCGTRRRRGHRPFQAAVRAIHDTLKVLRDGTAPADLKNLASKELMAKVTRSADYAGWTRDFLGGAGKG